MPMPMPVLRVITRLNIGGPARQALLLTRALASTHPTRLVTGRSAAGEGELLDDAVPITRIPLQRAPRPVDDVSAYRALGRLLASDRPAIVHTHMAKAGALGRLSARRARPRPRTIHTFHGHVLDGYFSKPVERVFIEAERRLARWTDVLIAVSSEVRDSLVELGVGTPGQYRVIPNGYDLAPHRAIEGRSGLLRGTLGLDDDVPLVGLVGRLVPIKQPSSALRAVAALPGVHLAVVGDGELRSSLEAEAAELGVADRAHFTGWLTDIPAVMADLDLVVLSSANEGTPSALVEAGACRKPVVATDVGGVRAVVDDGASGLLVPSGDEAALRAAINAVLADSARAAAMGRAGRELSWRYDEGRFVADIVALYDELAGA